MLAALSHAWRSWKGAAGLAALAIAAFAVGIGSATAIYTVVSGVILRPLPYAGGERFVAIYGARFTEPDQRSAHTFPDLLEYQQRTRAFDLFGWFRPASFNLTFAGLAQHVDGLQVTPSLAHNLGVQPRLGTWFTDDRGAVISSPLWTRLGADPGIVGKAIALDGQAFTVTGVMPPAFRLPVPGPGVERLRSDVWIALDPLGKGQPRGEGMFFSYARLKPGVSLGQAEEDVRRVAAEIAALDPVAHPAYTGRVDALRESVILTVKPTLLLLSAAAGLLLLITCADVAGLLLARSVGRARETAIRVALGAPHRQLALHYFAEGLLVSLAGAALGVLLSIALVRFVLSIAAEHIPRADEIAIDPRVLLFALATAFAASALASLAPLWQAIRTAPADVLNEGARSSAGSRTLRLSESLVVVEIALAFTLLAAGAVLIGHVRGLSRVDPGFDPNGLLTFRLTSPQDPEARPDERAASRARWTSALARIPGVTSVGIANQIPLSGCCLTVTLYPEGRPADLDAVQRTSFMSVTPDYVQTMRIPLREGRLLEARDGREGVNTVVVSEAASKMYWPGRSPVGEHVRLGTPDGPRFQVVGVVGSTRNDGLGKPPVPELYFPDALVRLNPMRFVVRSTLAAETLIPAVRQAIQGVDPLQPIYDVTTMRSVALGSLSFERLASFMVMFFALAALLMATLGIYGVVSYSVRRSTVEIGTRMALGAAGRDLLGMVVGRGLKMTALGVTLGAVAVIGATTVLVRAFEIRGLGIWPFLASTAAVTIVAAAASFFPAWRATQLSPMVAIRNEPESTWRSTRERLRRAVADISRAVSSPERAEVAASEVLAEFVSAARSATSFPEAFRSALATLCTRLEAPAGFVLELQQTGYRTIASYPDGRELTLPAGGFLANHVRSYAHPRPIDERDLDAWLRWAQDHRPIYTEEISRLKDSPVGMAVALRARGEILGFLLLGRREKGAWSDGEREALRHAGEQLTLMIENARLTARVVEQEKLRRDLALAAEVQRRLLPDEPPQHPGAALAAISLPARTIGGDYYDFLDLGDQRFAIALADIAGKGIAAALIMAVVRTSLRIVASEGPASLPELAARMNDLLHRSTRSNSYATFFYAQLDERSRVLRYVNAGHNPPYLVRLPHPSVADSTTSPAPEIRELSVGGTVIGLFPEMAYQEGSVRLQAGDVLVAFTDGVTEALNAAEEEFGEERLKAVLRGLLHLPAAEISARLTQELRTWIKDAPQHDDLTFVVMKVV
jgi:predicted permease